MYGGGSSWGQKEFGISPLFEKCIDKIEEKHYIVNAQTSCNRSVKVRR